MGMSRRIETSSANVPSHWVFGQTSTTTAATGMKITRPATAAILARKASRRLTFTFAGRNFSAKWRNSSTETKNGKQFISASKNGAVSCCCAYYLPRLDG